MSKPIVLHLSDDIKWIHGPYKNLQEEFTIKRSYSMNRADFMQALKTEQFGDFVAMYRPFWNTGGEMDNWDDELIYTLLSFSYCDHLVLKLLTDRFSQSFAKSMLVQVLGLIE